MNRFNPRAAVVVIIGFMVAFFAPGYYWLLGCVIVFYGSSKLFTKPKPTPGEMGPEEYLRCDDCHGYVKDVGPLYDRTGLYLCRACIKKGQT